MTDCVFLLAVIHQTTTFWTRRYQNVFVFLLAVIHQTTTRFPYRSSYRHVFLLAVIHQTTTESNKRFQDETVFLLAVIHQTTTPLRLMFSRLMCFYWRLYIKPQRRKCKGLKDNEITSAEFSKKWRCKYLIVAKLLKKFQLYRLRDFLFLDGSPNIDNVAVLSICNGQNAYFAMLRYR